MRRFKRTLAAVASVALPVFWMAGCEVEDPGAAECACRLEPSAAGEDCEGDACCLCMVGCRTDDQCPSVMRCGFVQDAAYVSGSSPGGAGLLSCSCGEPQSQNGSFAACVPASSAAEFALVNGFGVQEMALSRVPDTFPPLFGWEAPAGARTVSCALFGCEPRFSVRSDEAGQQVTYIVNFDTCVLSREEYTALSSGFDPTKTVRDDATGVTETAVLASGNHTVATRATLPLATLSVGCWAYDGDALIASTRLTPVTLSDLPAFSAFVSPDCQGADPLATCSVPGTEAVSLGSCFDDACLPRCTSWEHCHDPADLDGSGVRCFESVVPKHQSDSGLWGVMGVCLPCTVPPDPERPPPFVRIEDQQIGAAKLCEETGKSLSQVANPWDLHCQLSSGKGASVALDPESPLPSTLHVATLSRAVSLAALKEGLESIDKLAAADVLLFSAAERGCPPDGADDVREIGEYLGWDWVFGVELLTPSSPCEEGHAIVSRYPLGDPRLVPHDVGSITKGALRAPVDLSKESPPRLGRRAFLTADIQLQGGKVTLVIESLESDATAAEQQEQSRELAAALQADQYRAVAHGRFFPVMPALGDACFSFPKPSVDALPFLATRGVRATPFGPGSDLPLFFFDLEAL